MKKALKYVSTLMALVILSILLTSCGGGGEVYDGLVGRWHIFGSYGMAYTFNADGTGQRGSETFTWTVSDDTLRLSRDREFVGSREIRNERWTFALGANGRLSLSSQQERGLTINLDYAGNIYAPLVGTWHWDAEPAWRRVFNADGTGERGFEGESDSFLWGVVDGQVRIFVYMTGGLTDSWNMTITGDILRFEHTQDAGSVFYYMRG